MNKHQEITAQLTEELRIKNHAFRSALSPIAISDPEGNLTYVNPAFLEVWGYEDGTEVLGREAVEFWQMEEEAAQVIAELKKSGRWSGELRARRKSGASFDVQVAASMVTDEDDQPLGMMASFLEITKRKRAERELQQREERFRALIQNASDIITILEENCTIRYQSPAIRRVLGHEPADLIGRDVFEFVHPDDRAGTEEAFTKVVNDPDAVLSIEFRFLCKDGSYRVLEATGSNQLHHPAIEGVVINSRDVTERKSMEEVRRRQRERLLAIIKHFPEILYVVDPETFEVIFVNDAFKELLGSNPVGQTCYEAFQGFDEPCDFCTNEIIQRTGEPYTWEYHNHVLDRDYLITDQLIRWPDGRDVRFEVAIDITARKQAEALASQASVLEGINRIFRDALQGETEEELAKTSLAIAEQLTGSQFGFICEVNQRGRLDTIAISNPGWDECLIEDSEELITAQDLPVRGIRGRVIKEGRAIIFNEPAAHTDWIEPPEGHPRITSFIGVPLEDAQGSVAGMIALANKEKGYDDDDREALETLSVAVVQALEQKRMETALARQAKEILELSTPTMQVWDGIIAAPLIGTLDSQRTQHFMEDLLIAIVETGSEIALVDITGVPTVDTVTAQHVIETISAVRLLGADVILTGVRPSIAQTLVNLGIDLSHITTRSSLVAGLRVALRKMDVRICE